MKQEISQFNKNKTEVVKISLTEYEGHNLIDIRAFTKNSSGGEPLPTKKGLTLSVHNIKPLIQALMKAGIMARDNGLLEQ